VYHVQVRRKGFTQPKLRESCKRPEVLSLDDEVLMPCEPHKVRSKKATHLRRVRVTRCLAVAMVVRVCAHPLQWASLAV